MNYTKGVQGFKTKYNADTLLNAAHYVNGEYAKLGQCIPTSAGLARHLKCCRMSLYLWAKKYTEFNEVIESLNCEQEMLLVNGGLSNKYNANITKLMLSQHGYHSKVDTDVTSAGEAITQIQIVALTDDELMGIASGDNGIY